MNKNIKKFKDELKRIDEILEKLPEIRSIISKGGGWDAIKVFCKPLGLTDTAFRDNPRLGDYLMDREYWQNRKDKTKDEIIELLENKK